MTTSEAKVLKFLSCHSPGHCFNVTEVWNWLYDRYNVAPPSTTTLRKYVKKHADDVRNGIYMVRENPEGR